jgi:hypothetical protein
MWADFDPFFFRMKRELREAARERWSEARAILKKKKKKKDPLPGKVNVPNWVPSV